MRKMEFLGLCRGITFAVLQIWYSAPPTELRRPLKHDHNFFIYVGGNADEMNAYSRNMKHLHSIA